MSAHTEEEATQCWCPFARVDGLYSKGSDATVHNRLPDGDITMSAMCVGSRCMAWRWANTPRRQFHVSADCEARVEPERAPGTPASWVWCPYDEMEGDYAGWLEPEEECNARRRGYCGLAGKPTGD